MRQTTIPTMDGPLVTFDRLSRKLLKLLPNEPWQAAVACAAAARRYINPGMVGLPGKFSVWQLGGLALASLNRCNVPTPDQRTQLHGLEQGYFHSLMYVASGLNAEGGLWSPATQRRYQARLTLLRVACTQSSLQGDLLTQLGSTLYLLGTYDLDGSPLESSVDILFEEAFGCRAGDYASIMAMLWSLCQKSDAFTSSSLLAGAPPFTQDSVNKIVAELTCRVSSVRKVLRQSFGRHKGGGIVHAFYARYPLLGLAADEALFPPHPFLRFHLARGVLFKAIELAVKSEAARGNPKPENNKYLQSMGRRFENLVSCVLNHARCGDVVNEYEYRNKPNAKTADFMVFSRQNDACVVIQAKMKRLSRGAFFGSDLEAFRRDARETLAASVVQSIRFMRKLEQASNENALAAEGKDDSRRLLSACRWMLVSVVPAMPPVFRFNEFRRVLEDGLSEQLDPEDRKWWVNNQNRVAGWHVIELEELTWFARCRQGRDLFEALEEYLGQSNFGEITESFPASFKDFILKTDPSTEPPRHIPELEAIHNEFWSQTRQYLGFRGEQTNVSPAAS
ncbi:MAG: hypothetical protein R3C68_09860 [Myxococcota bacterium]